ncbi:peptidase domain-containing ABC transporter [Nostoc sp. FACHB-888]|uniref:peptidase domain-containing ABC transporter n=1 Tax=Nostoc sp. FACHB-888 TaxID=2692842 RepID=UPI001685A3FB|nr:peptidase domain-containing ABC transporter [Nostoc sp. FACHB-888]MBD2244236.1 peptidase domain-containing ABC transporter [Nostoc sp. FACHB-888]
MSSVFSQQLLHQQITLLLGEKLSEQEIASCLKLAEIFEPPVAKQFWLTTAANPGIYIVLAGKVRVLDNEENLITTLSAGSCFGEGTLFAQEAFQPYAVRASTNLKLCYLKQEILLELMDRFPGILDRLFKRAELWDLVMLYRQNSQLLSNPLDVPGILKALSLFERHNLSLQQQIIIPNDCKLLLLQKGELRNSEGHALTPGKIYSEAKPGAWQATQPVVAYILRDSNWQIAKEDWQQLSEFVEIEERKAVVENQKTPHSKPKPERISSSSNVISFPQREQSPKQKQKKSLSYFPSPKVKVRQVWGSLTKTYPFYAQQSSADCGAACLAMIGRYWGKQFSVNRLREQANVSRSGSSLRALAAAAESLGFSTRPVKASLDKFAEQPLPAIAHWQGKHYIVVYKITNKQVIVADPAIGQLSLTHAQLNEGWTGYALLMQPTALFKQAEEGDASLWQFFELVKPYSKVLLEVFLASVLIQIFGLVTPLFTQLLLDRVIVQGSTITLNAVGFGLLIFGLFRIIINGVRQYLLDHTANRVSVAMLVGFIKHTFDLPLSFFESRYVGDIVSRIQENQKIQRFLTGEALSICLDLMTVFIYVGLMFWYSWQMALLVLLIVPPFFLLALFSTSILRRLSREIFTAGAEENSYLIQSLTGIRSVRSMAIEQTVRWHWEELLNKLIKKGFRAQVVANRLQIISATIETLITTGLLWYGASLVIQNQLTIGQLVAFNMLLGNVIHPFQRLSVLWNQLQEVMISAERINDVLEAEPEEDLFASPRQALRKFCGRIRFENVTFRYHGESETNVLENLSFEIEPEQTVAVVGRSGSGKTTLSKLILGLYPPTEGKILIDDHDVTSISLKSLRSQIGVVDQDTFLFGGTIRENLSIAHPEASLEEIIEAATLAGANEFIQKLPMGYETQIGEGGGMLSGGQRQRLAIARALLGNPRFLIFDEATSNLDAESERIIQNNLNTILKRRTSLIIAHRLSTVRNADLILVLDRGILTESGTHDELISKKGHYYYLNQQQLAQAG